MKKRITGANLMLALKENNQRMKDYVDASHYDIKKYQKYVNTGLDYCYLRPNITAGDISISEGFIIPFIVHNGNMEYNPDNYSVKLKGGKTYKIESDMYVYCDVNYVHYILYDITNDIELYFGTKTSANLNNNISGDFLEYIYTPENDCEIQIKISTPATKMQIYAQKAFLSIQEINRQIVIDPLEYVNTSQGIEDTPVGHIISHMGTVAPKHYLICDGTEYNIEEYPYLAQHIQNNFGTVNYFGGDGDTTFAVPDLRGEFLRGTGNAGANVGTHQDATQVPRMPSFHNAETNQYLYTRELNPDGGSNDLVNPDIWIDSGRNVRRYMAHEDKWLNTHLDSEENTRVAYAGTVRPTNTSVLYCIKYEPTYFMNTYNTNYMQPSMYSEEERIVGCWIDGKPLYEKTIKTIIPWKDTRTVIASLPENIDYVTISSCYAFSETSKMSFNIVFSGTNGNNGNDCVWISLSEGIVMQLTSGINISLCYVTVQYTKTTDEENSFTNDMLKDSYVELTYSDEEIYNEVASILSSESNKGE